MPQPCIGLALGSGLARGWAHIGVLRALLAAGIAPDLICGTSIGALVGGIYLCGRLDTLEAWARGLNKLKIIGYLDFQLSGGGMIAGERLLAVLERHLGEATFESLPIPFAAIATDLMTGHEVWLRQGRLTDALRASFSLPGVFAPVNADGRWLVDGAMVNPLPAAACRALGAQVVIAVNLHADVLGRNRYPGSNIPRAAGFDLLQEMPKADQSGLGAVLAGILSHVFGRAPDVPSLFGVMVQSLNIMQDRITRSRLAGEPPDVSVNPRLGHVGLLEFDRAAEAIEEGRAAMERVLPDLRDAIQLFGGRVP